MSSCSAQVRGPRVSVSEHRRRGFMVAWTEAYLTLVRGRIAALPPSSRLPEAVVAGLDTDEVHPNFMMRRYGLFKVQLGLGR